MDSGNLDSEKVHEFKSCSPLFYMQLHNQNCVIKTDATHLWIPWSRLCNDSGRPANMLHSYHWLLQLDGLEEQRGPGITQIIRSNVVSLIIWIHKEKFHWIHGMMHVYTIYDIWDVYIHWVYYAFICIIVVLGYGPSVCSRVDASEVNIVCVHCLKIVIYGIYNIKLQSFFL